MASNEGGISSANVTLVHSPNVATYVGDGEAVISWLLTGGVASGVLIFLLLSLWLLFCSVQKARQRGCVTGAAKPSDGTGLNSSNGHLLSVGADESKVPSRSASIEAIEAATFEEQQLRQTTAVARAQRAATKANGGQVEASELKASDWPSVERPYPDLLDCHNYQEQPQQQQQPPPPPFQPNWSHHRPHVFNGSIPRILTPSPVGNYM